MTCIFTENVTLLQVFFKHFASQNQLAGLSVSGTLVENWVRAFDVVQSSASLWFYQRFKVSFI